MSNFGSAVSDINSASEAVAHDSSVNAEPEPESEESGKLGARIKRAKQKAADVQIIVVEKSRKTARVANDYVHERPWSTAGAALAVGVLIGLLVGRK